MIEGLLFSLVISGFFLPLIGAILAIYKDRWSWFLAGLGVPAALAVLSLGLIVLAGEGAVQRSALSHETAWYLSLWPFGMGVAIAALAIGVAVLWQLWRDRTRHDTHPNTARRSY